ncbi:MAG: sulfoxide reductase heme-binding subunit YedZ [Actinobacteria bacterium]|nr:sulfoxide reductase heme-binding subunit YedZ [Actinomycetota bacterium]
MAERTQPDASAARRLSTGALLLRIAAHAGALAPLAYLLWQTLTGGLSFDPIHDLTLRTGKPAFILLLLSLAARPAVVVTGVTALRPLARTLGLYAFGYATIHMLIFVGLDFGFRWDLIVGGVLEKRYAVIGLATFLILLTLAATSTRKAARRLGALWKRLHRLAYAAGVLATLHYLWAVKFITFEQWAYAVVLALLLVARLPEVEGRIRRSRSE